jgi:MYXO-CTERM domain-containing protein
VIDNGTDVADDDGDGLAEIEGDCDDASADVNPTAEEIANGVDDDCDGYVDEGLSDGDGDGWSVDDGDCDDADGWANPGRVELCDDGVDNDCDGDVDKLDTGCQASAAPITEDPGGCNVAGGQGAGWLGALALLGLVRRRR